jgi:polar amino acid transport system substrate-binding protein
MSLSLAAVIVSAAASLIIGVPTVTQAQAQKEIKIAVEGSFPPFNYLDADEKLQGFDVEVARALCAAADLQCDFIMQKWEDMIPNLNAGRFDAIVSSMSMSDERKKLVAFTDSYYSSPSVFVVRKTTDLPDLTSKSLGGLPLGVTLGTVQAAYVAQFYPDAKVTIFPSSPDLYKGLAEGDIDIAFEDKLAIYDWLTNTKAGTCCAYKGNDIIDPQFFGDGAGIAVRKQDDEIRNRLNTALAAITADGTYDAINAKYFPFSIR